MKQVAPFVHLLLVLLLAAGAAKLVTMFGCRELGCLALAGGFTVWLAGYAAGLALGGWLLWKIRGAGGLRLLVRLSLGAQLLLGLGFAVISALH